MMDQLLFLWKPYNLPRVTVLMIPNSKNTPANICLAIAYDCIYIKNNVETAINTLNIVSIAFWF
jgi:hypothetical protein